MTVDKHELQEEYKECGVWVEGMGPQKELRKRGKWRKRLEAKAGRISVCGSWFYFSFRHKILSVADYALFSHPLGYF